MAAVSYIAQDFKDFVLPLQAEKPMIPVLHHKLRKLLQNLFSKFLKDDVYLQDGELISMKKICSVGTNLEPHCFDY